MAPHSSTFAWKIPWMEEPGRLKSMGSLRVRHDWAASLSLFTFMHGEGNGNPLQYSCLENPRDRGAWWAFVYGVAQSRTRLKRLSSSSSSEIYGNIHSHSVLTISPCTGILHSMACHFIVLCRYCIFHKLKFCGSPYRAILLASLSVPFSHPHLRTSFLCPILVILVVFQSFCYYYICYSDLWSVILMLLLTLIKGSDEG